MSNSIPIRPAARAGHATYSLSTHVASASTSRAINRQPTPCPVPVTPNNTPLDDEVDRIIAEAERAHREDEDTSQELESEPSSEQGSDSEYYSEDESEFSGSDVGHAHSQELCGICHECYKEQLRQGLVASERALMDACKVNAMASEDAMRSAWRKELIGARSLNQHDCRVNVSAMETKMQAAWNQDLNMLRKVIERDYSKSQSDADKRLRVEWIQWIANSNSMMSNRYHADIVACEAKLRKDVKRDIEVAQHSVRSEWNEAMTKLAVDFGRELDAALEERKKDLRKELLDDIDRALGRMWECSVAQLAKLKEEVKSKMREELKKEVQQEVKREVMEELRSEMKEALQDMVKQQQQLDGNGGRFIVIGEDMLQREEDSV